MYTEGLDYDRQRKGTGVACETKEGDRGLGGGQVHVDGLKE